MVETTSTSTPVSAPGLMMEAVKTTVRHPVRQLAWAVSLPVAIALSATVWGDALTVSGWLSARRRLGSDGLIGLGDVFAPSASRRLYADGIWRGLWRVHGFTVAFVIIQLLPALMAMTPAMIARYLLRDLETIWSGWGTLLAVGIPGVLALIAAIVVAAQGLLTLRLVTEAGAPHSLGQVWRATGQAWRSALKMARGLVLVSVVLLVATLIVGAAIGGFNELLEWLEMGHAGRRLLVQWVTVFLGAGVTLIFLETVASWAQNATATAPERTSAFSFTDWLVAWLTAALDWLKARGTIQVGIGACLVVGLLTAAAAVLSGRNFTSWVGLGWFAVTAAILVTLRFFETRKSS